MTRKTILALTLFVSLSSSPAWAQDRYDSQVGGQVVAMTLLAMVDGYGLPQQYNGDLNDDNIEWVQVTLNGSGEHLVLGACDVDCSDLDLVLYDNAGKRLAADMQRDSIPTIRIPKGYTGSYRLKVVMASCSVGPCRYRVALYSK